MAVCAGAFMLGLLAGPEAAWITELFPTRYRCAGGSLAYQGTVICRRAPASGTRSSIACFPLSGQNWRGKPLISHEMIVNLIAGTTTETGLIVHSELDTDSYPPGVKVSDREVAKIDLRRDNFHGDWNYTLPPRRH